MKKSINIRKILREELRNFIIKENSEQEMYAYHGTSHKFDKFSTDFMGSGQGSQAYGWGIYVTQNPKTGRYYAEANNVNREELNKDIPQRAEKIAKGILKNIDNKALFKLVAYDVITIYYNKPNLIIYVNSEGNVAGRWTNEEKEQLFEYVANSLLEDEKSLPFVLDKRYFDEMDNAEKSDEILNQIANYSLLSAARGEGRNHGSETRILYTVDIPDDNGQNYLYWEKRLTDEEIDNIFVSLLKKKEYNIKKDENRLIWWYNGGIKDSISLTNCTGMLIYTTLTRELFGGFEKSTSLYLDSIGYDGISMPVGYNHGITDGGEGLRNYVIFDPNKIKILNKITY